MYFTEKQLRIMEFIQSYRAERGISPSMEEIAEKFGVTKITIYEHLNQLERKGALKREKFRARSIEPLISVEERQGRFVLPLLGSIQAGAPLQTCEEEKTLNLASILPLSKQCFALRVQGNSMIGDQIRHGDYVIVERRSTAENGDTVVAVLDDGRATLKRYYRERNRIRLQPANSSMKPTYVKEVEVRGVVIGLLRNFSPAEEN